SHRSAETADWRVACNPCSLVCERGGGHHSHAYRYGQDGDDARYFGNGEMSSTSRSSAHRRAAPTNYRQVPIAWGTEGPGLRCPGVLSAASSCWDADQNADDSSGSRGCLPIMQCSRDNKRD